MLAVSNPTTTTLNELCWRCVEVTTWGHPPLPLPPPHTPRLATTNTTLEISLDPAQCTRTHCVVYCVSSGRGTTCQDYEAEAWKKTVYSQTLLSGHKSLVLKDKMQAKRTKKSKYFKGFSTNVRHTVLVDKHKCLNQYVVILLFSYSWVQKGVPKGSKNFQKYYTSQNSKHIFQTLLWLLYLFILNQQVCLLLFTISILREIYEDDFMSHGSVWVSTVNAKTKFEMYTP